MSVPFYVYIISVLIGCAQSMKLQMKIIPFLVYDTCIYISPYILPLNIACSFLMTCMVLNDIYLQFSTPDSDNADGCAAEYSMGWWWGGCGQAGLTGAYGVGKGGHGIYWGSHADLPYVDIKIKANQM